MIIIQLLIVLLALYVGSRYGSIALGVISGIGLAILVFAFGLKPGTPPTDVIYIIIAAVTCAGVLPSVYGYFFIPNYPSDIATVNFNRSGTTVIGKYLLNHSFMVPGLISVTVSCIVGYILANIVY